MLHGFINNFSTRKRRYSLVAITNVSYEEYSARMAALTSKETPCKINDEFEDVWSGLADVIPWNETNSSRFLMFEILMNKGWTWKLVSWPWRRSMETFFRDIIIVPSVAVSARLVIKQYDRDLTKNLEIFIYDCENVARATNCDSFCTIVSTSAPGTYYLTFRI